MRRSDWSGNSLRTKIFVVDCDTLFVSFCSTSACGDVMRIAGRRAHLCALYVSLIPMMLGAQRVIDQGGKTTHVVGLIDPDEPMGKLKHVIPEGNDDTPDQLRTLPSDMYISRTEKLTIAQLASCSECNSLQSRRS